MASLEEKSKAGRSKPNSRVHKAPPIAPDSLGEPFLNERARQVASQFSQNAISPFFLALTLRFAEFSLIMMTAIGVYLYYVHPLDGFQPVYPAAGLLAASLYLVGMQIVDGYHVATLRTRFSQHSKVAITWTVSFALLAVAAFFLQISIEFSRIWFATWFVGGLATLLLFRAVVSARVRLWARNGLLERRAVIVGGGEHGRELIAALEAQPDSDIRICGIFDDRGNERSPPVLEGYPKLGTMSELVDFGRQAQIDMLIISLPITAEKRVMHLLKTVRFLPIDIRLSAQSNQLRFRPRSYSYVGTVPFFDIVDKPITDWDSILKRGFDVLFGGFFLVLLAPLMALIALAIRIESPGPILFRQKRFGFNNEIIEVLKFRSMYHDMADADAKQVVTKNDRRVTRMGRYLRKTSLDELPQLVNVLYGELSLVGPRPHAVNAHTHNRPWGEVVDDYFCRHRVKPGVTGWAQINGWRGEVDNERKIRQRVEHDLYYIENWSVLFDLYILLATPAKLINDENAY